MLALHFLFGRLKGLFKGAVEFIKGGNIVEFALGHKVEIFFHFGGKFGIDDILEKVPHKSGGHFS